MTSGHHEMTCRELVAVITDYLEGKLPEAERRRFEAQLGECSYCANYLEQMRATIVTLGELREKSLSPATRDALLDAFRDWKPAAGGREWHTRHGCGGCGAPSR
jgi:anti-sigma factor RsiW